MLKIFHAISNMPKPTVASNVSRARVSNSVMKHHPFRSKASGAFWDNKKWISLSDAKPERRDRLPYVDNILAFKYTRRISVFQHQYKNRWTKTTERVLL